MKTFLLLVALFFTACSNKIEKVEDKNISIDQNLTPEEKAFQDKVDNYIISTKNFVNSQSEYISDYTAKTTEDVKAYSKEVMAIYNEDPAKELEKDGK